jgi:hypothetical protein
MELLDRFSRTFLSAAFASGARRSRVSRHAPVLRSCVGDRDSALALARCGNSGRRVRSYQLLLLTRNRLVVTTEDRLTRRLRLHLNAELHHLADVTWTSEPALGVIKLSATAIDGVREHFSLELGSATRVEQVGRLLTEAFRGGLRGARAAQTDRPAAGQLVAA